MTRMKIPKTDKVLRGEKGRVRKPIDCMAGLGLQWSAANNDGSNLYSLQRSWLRTWVMRSNGKCFDIITLFPGMINVHESLSV